MKITALTIQISEFCDIFALKNLISDITCVAKNGSSSSDVILTNKKRSLKNSCAVFTGIRDFYKMTITTLRTSYERLKPIRIKYCSYKHLNKNHFIHDLGMAPFHKRKDKANENEAFDCSEDIFLSVVNKHAPTKTEIIRGTEILFLNRELSKAIMHRSKLKNIFNKTKSEEAWIAFKKQRNKCVSITCRNFARVTNNGGSGGKVF